MSRDGILTEITQLPESTEELYLVALDDAKNGGANFNLDNMPSQVQLLLVLTIVTL